jgi:flagellar basal-body rod modification protein FlgD
MDVSPTTAAGTTPLSAGGAAREEAAVAPATDFQTFLTLLTAQMRNQDPLKPMESTEFVAQLASFSAVEQQIRSNDRLDRIVEALAGGSSGGIAQWIGREVRAPAAANFTGVPVEAEVTPKAEADSAVMVVINAAGQEVVRRPVDARGELVRWDGQNAMGQTLAHGSYKIMLESYQGEQVIDTQVGRVYAPVSEVRLEAGAATLILEGGERVALDAVTGVR